MYKRWLTGCYLSCCLGLILATPAFGQRYLNSSTDSVEAVQDTAADLNMTEANSGDIKTAVEATKLNTDNIPASPAEEHITAASPHACRLSDGTSFYNATTPFDTQPISGTITANQGGAPWQVQSNSANLATESTLSAAEALLTTIDGDTSTLAAGVSGGQYQCDIAADSVGLATSANQLADGHNVTVDNAAGVAAVNIQDGGNVITVDGTVGLSSGTGPVSINSNTSKDGLGVDYYPLLDTDGKFQVDISDSLPAGTNNIGDVDVLTLPDVTQSTHDSLNANANMQVADTDVSITNPLPIEGADAVGATRTDNPIVIGGQTVGGQVQPYTAYAAGSLYLVPNIIADLDGNKVVEINAVSSSTEGELVIGGSRAHDDTDTVSGRDSWPVKIGGKATDYEPDTVSEPSGGASEVAAADRVDIAVNRYGEQVEGVNKVWYYPTNIDDAYENTTTRTSGDIEVWNYRECRFSYCLDSTGAPTRMTFVIRGSNDGTVDYEYREGFLSNWMHEDVEVSSEICFSYPFRVHHRYISITATCTGCSSASVKFDIDDAEVSCSN